jgi:hypothetical protein
MPLAERAGNPALADACRPGNEQVLFAADPIPIDELGKEGAIDAARSAQIDIFDNCGLPQRGELQAHDEPFVLPLGCFAIDH